MLIVDNLLDQLKDAKVYFDLRTGYHQMRGEEPSSEDI